MRVLIVGAGLSGLTLATFLRRLNIDCLVLEKAPYLLANYANPFVLYANALSCYKAFGLDHIYRHEDVDQMEAPFGIMDDHQRWLLRLRNRTVRLSALGAEDVIPYSTAPKANSESVVSTRLAEQRKMELGEVPLRAVLSSENLRESLRRHIPTIKFGYDVVDLVPHDGIKGGVHALGADGSTEWGDVVVGADGMFSTIRRLLYPEEHIGTSWRSLGITQVDGCSASTTHGVQHPCELWGDGVSLSIYPHAGLHRNRVGFTATLATPLHTLVDPSTADRDGCEALQPLLERSFAHFGDGVASIFRQMDYAAPSELLEVPVMPRWFNRRAVLIGDAAHGSLPSFLQQDASLCVEDAAILATSLVDIPLQRDSGYEYAFAQYESVRRDRVERYIRQSRRARRFSNTSHTTLRNTALRLTPSPLVYALQRWLSNWTYSAQQLEVDPKTKMETAFR